MCWDYQLWNLTTIFLDVIHSFSTTLLVFTPSLRLPGQPEQQEPYRLHLVALQRPAETLLAKPPRWGRLSMCTWRHFPKLKYKACSTSIIHIIHIIHMYIYCNCLHIYIYIYSIHIMIFDCQFCKPASLGALFFLGFCSPSPGIFFPPIILSQWSQQASNWARQAGKPSKPASKQASQPCR